MVVSEPTGEHAKIHHRRKEMAWLTHEQIVELLADCKRQDPILALVVKICLKHRRTLAWSRKSYPLTGDQIPNYLCQNEGKKNRSIPISKELLRRSWRSMGSISSQTAIFNFLSVMEKTSIVLPRGQLTRSAPYVCSALHDVGWKHSGLTKILGHHDIKWLCVTHIWHRIIWKRRSVSILWQRCQVATKWRQRLALPQ